MVKVLHTSDWHLGKKLYKKERWPEQQAFLEWLINVIKDEQVEVLIIAGDIFDTPLPPSYALKGLFDFYRKIDDLTCLKKVIVIAGNHDSAKLIEAPTNLLSSKFHILGRPYNENSQSDEADALASWQRDHKVTYQRNDRERPIQIGLLPFFRSSDLLLKDPALLEQNKNSDKSDKSNKEERGTDISPDQILLRAIEFWLGKWDLAKKDYNIFVGHHLYGSFMESGSEQGVGLSGLASLPLGLFSDWDLLCLGHIHKPQCIKKENPMAYYSGSPIPMRFSEREQKKINIYEFETQLEDKSIQLRQIPIPTMRKLLQIESTPDKWTDDLDEILKAESDQYTDLEAFLELTLKFDTPEPSFIDTIREYLQEKNIELLNYYQIINQKNLDQDSNKGIDAKKIQTAQIDELFDLYLEEEGVPSKDKERIKETFHELTHTYGKTSSQDEKDEKGERGESP